MQELPSVGREAFDILPLPFGEQRIERERTLARTARTRDDDQAVARDVEIDVLQVVDAGPADADDFRRGSAVAAWRRRRFSQIRNRVVSHGQTHRFKLMSVTWAVGCVQRSADAPGGD